MTTDEWHKIETIVDEALELPEDEREAFINNRCSNDEKCIKYALSFLDSIEKADLFFSGKKKLKDKVADFATTERTREFRREDLIGKTIGSYKLTGLLGEGGMGAVYLAVRTDGQFDHSVAIKIIRNDLGKSGIYNRFVQERQILAGLTHENIARLYDGGVTENGLPYLIMEHVDGIPIDAYCDQNQLSFHERINLFKSVCSAAQYAHKNLVIHRDLKPQNILITKDGTVKIMDFGIAKLIHSERSENTTLDADKPSRFLSFSNAAPEQLTHEPVTTASDIYALGVLLHRLLAGIHPLSIDKKTGNEIVRIIKKEIPVAASKKFRSLNSDQKKQIARHRNVTVSSVEKLLRVDLDAIVLKCLQKKPAERYQTVDDLVHDLDRYEKGYPVSALKGSRLYYVKKYVNRNSAKLLVAAAFFIIMTMAGMFYTHQIQQERDIARMEANKATQITSFVLDLFKGSDPTETRGGEISARDLLDRGIERTTYLTNQPEIKANMLEVLGRILTQLGEFDEAQDLLTQSIEIKSEIFGKNHPETFSGYEYLGSLLSSRGELFEARNVLEDVINKRTLVLGPGQSALSEANTELGYVYRRLGKLQEAEDLYRYLIDIYESHLGANDPLTLLSISSLGVTLHGQGKLDEAEIRYRDVLEKRSDLYVTMHPDVAMSMNNLGALLLNQGRFEESESLLSAALEMRMALFGKWHPKVALSTNNMGILKRNTGDFETAKEYFDNALEINTRLFGTEQLQTGINMFSMAELYMMTGDYERSLDFYNQSNQIFIQQLPEGSSFISRSMMGVGEALIHVEDNKLTDAEYYLTTGFERVKELHPSGSIEYGLALIQMGKLNLYKNNKDSGIEYLVEAYNILSQIEGSRGVRTLAISDLLLEHTGERIVLSNR
ncbi:hypothetical protein BH23BAC3_BH23BAC3_04980 [soil metagenome]